MSKWKTKIFGSKHNKIFNLVSIEKNKLRQRRKKLHIPFNDMLVRLFCCPPLFRATSFLMFVGLDNKLIISFCFVFRLYSHWESRNLVMEIIIETLGRFHQHFTRTFVSKIASVSSLYIHFSFVILGAKMLAKNLRIKCWWNWDLTPSLKNLPCLPLPLHQ